MDMDKMPRKLWEHPNPKGTAMWHFMQESNKLYNLNMKVRPPSPLLQPSMNSF